MNSSGTKEDKSTTIAGPFAPVLRSMHTYSTYNFEYDSQELLLVQKNKWIANTFYNNVNSLYTVSYKLKTVHLS